MKEFNKDKELKKLIIKHNKNTYIKKVSIVISCFILLIGIIYFSFAKFASTKEFVLINGTVSASSTDTNAKAVDYITEIAETTDSLVTDETEDNNLRYIGADPNNYIEFNDELWRIIGVMNNIETESGETKSLLKIRRAESLGSYSWDSSAASVNSGWGVNEWSQADLMQELNNDYLGTITVGTDGYWYRGTSNAKAAAMPSTTISTAAQNQIETVVWNLGSPNNNNGTALDNYDTTLKASYTYEHERSNLSGKVCTSTSGQYCTDTVSRTTAWTGKVALMYPSDYMYATSGGTTTNRVSCLNISQGDWISKKYSLEQDSWISTSYADCSNNDWLSNSSLSQLTLSPYAYSSRAHWVYSVAFTGIISYDYSGLVYPVVFLKSDIRITGGDGTSENPYTIR